MRDCDRDIHEFYQKSEHPTQLKKSANEHIMEYSIRIYHISKMKSTMVICVGKEKNRILTATLCKPQKRLIIIINQYEKTNIHRDSVSRP